MKKQKLSGFSPVYAFTLKNQMKSGKYIAITAIFALLLIAGIAIAFLVAGKPDDETEGFQIEQAYVVDKTGLGVPQYAMFAESMQDKDIAGMTFDIVEDEEKTIEKHKTDKKFVLLVQEETEDGYLIEVVEGEESELDDSDLELLGTQISYYFQMHVYQNSGLAPEALAQALTPVLYEVSDFGEEVDEMKELVEVLCTMLFLMVVYFMVLIYGMQICTEVSLEKTSKLVEQLLTSVTPYGMVAGKTLAVITASIIQFLIWVISALIGLFGGDKLAGTVYPEYESKITVITDALSGWFGEMAFSPVSIILAVLILVAGLVFYLLLAGVAGSAVTKPEDASNVQSIYIFPMIIAFFIALSAIVEGEGHVALWYHFIPFLSALVTPGAVLMGDVSVLLGIASFAITIVLSMVFLAFAARVYKSLLFFNGSKMTMKTLFKMLKGTKNS